MSSSIMYSAAPHGYQQQRTPPSPLSDHQQQQQGTRISLPSISCLLDLAGQGSPTAESAHMLRQSSQDYFSSRAGSRPSSSHRASTHSATTHSSPLPPSPPMATESAPRESFNSAPSAPITRTSSPAPSMSAASSSSSSGGYYACQDSPQTQTQPQMQPQMQPRNDDTRPRHIPTSHAVPQHRTSYGNMYPSYPAPYDPRPQRSVPMVFHPQPQHPQQHRPTAYPQGHYRTMQQPTPPPQNTDNGYFQGPPQAYAPRTTPWQHHHYISPSAAASFPQSQDRYICGTCNKAFSRPSSLRIHSHSHTGEKPFKCPRRGCGKAFSVRSNMKRHERGCHDGEYHH